MIKLSCKETEICLSPGELNGECDLMLLSVTSCECPECDFHFSTRTNFPDKYLMRSRTTNTWGLPSATT